MPTEDDEIEFEEEEGAEEEEESDPATAEHESSPPPKKRGRKPGSRNKPKGVAPQAPGAAPLPSAGIHSVSAGEPDPDSPPTWGDDPRTVWPLLVEYCISHGYTNVPDAVSINVSRQSSSPGYTGPMQALSSIPVSAVLGDERTDPGEALMRYIIQVYHLGSDRPARYELRFLYRPNRSRLIKIAHVDLADPREISAAQSRAASMQAAQAYQGPSTYGMGAWPQPAPPQSYPTVPTIPRDAPPQSQHAPSPGHSGGGDPGVQQAVEGMRRELAMVFGAMSAQQQAEAARQLGMGAPPLAPSTPPPLPWSQSQPQAQAEMIASTVAATLKALGFGPQVPPPVPPAVGVGAPPPSAAPMVPAFNPYLVAQQTAPTLSGMVADLRDRAKSFHEFAKIKREFEGIQEALGFGASSEEEEEEAAPASPPPDPNVPPFAVRKIPFSGSAISGGQDINWVSRATEDGTPKPFQDWAMEMAAANPQFATNVVEQATRIIDNSSIGALIKQAAERNAAGGVARVPAALGTGAVPASTPSGYTPP